MNRELKKIGITNGILWASAILSAAILHAPVFYTIILLPVLASTSAVAIRTAASLTSCAG